MTKAAILLGSIFPPSSERSRTASGIRVFLSHKHDQREEMEQAMALLRSQDVSVYVDWQDGNMPSKTSGETATLLREKISTCQKFVLLATPEAIRSRWCNWELGVADVLKFPRHVVLLPIAKDDGTWPGSEYLQRYARIETAFQYLTGHYSVVHEAASVPLSQWLVS
jgi:hypothetical protein